MRAPLILSKRRPDLALLHPPSVYDFRRELLLPSPVADLVPSGQFFEMFPIGFSFLGEYLERNGFRVRVVNLAARMLEDGGFDVERFLSRLEPRAFGIGLHWLPHCHGAIEVARLCKKLHPDIPVVMGGYSASIFHRELLSYPEVDFVVRGDSAEEPVRLLLGALDGEGSLRDVPNLSYRDSGTGDVIENELSYVPDDLGHLGDNYTYMIRSALRYRDVRSLKAFRGWWSYPLTAVLTCRGCRFECAFCGGSASAMKCSLGRSRAAFRSPAAIARDVRTISSFTGAPIFVIGDLRQAGDDYARDTLEALFRLSPRNHLVLELFTPAPGWFLERAAASLPNFDLEISPESHDESVRRAAGKHYGNEELERTIARALAAGCGKIDVFFMIGLSGQDSGSVRETIAYCGRLMEEYGPRVNPLIGPLAPFIDPGCAFERDAGEHGYTLLAGTLEEYRRALLHPNWRDILGYETRWMSRQDVFDATYEALLELNRLKREHGVVSPEFAAQVESLLEDGRELLLRADQANAAAGPAGGAELARIKEEADALRERSYILKEELKWPIEGRRFRYLNIARMLLGRGTAHEYI